MYFYYMIYENNKTHIHYILPQYKTDWGGYLMPVNVAAHGTACTLNTRYEQMALPLDILSLAHYPKTVVLMERDI